MLRLALGDHLAGGDVQGREQRGRAVAQVVVRVALRVAELHGRFRLGPVVGLDLRFLLDAEHHLVVRRIEVNPRNIRDFPNEEGIRGELEGLGQVRLDTEQAEAAGYGTGRDALDRPHAVGAPVGSIRGLLLQGPVDHPGDPFVVVSARAAEADFVVRALDAVVEIAPAPIADSLPRSGDPAGGLSVDEAILTGEDHAGVQDQGMGHGGGVGDPLQQGTVGLADRERSELSSTWHGNVLGAWTLPFYQTYLLYGTLGSNVHFLGESVEPRSWTLILASLVDRLANDFLDALLRGPPRQARCPWRRVRSFSAFCDRSSSEFRDPQGIRRLEGAIRAGPLRGQCKITFSKGD